MTVFNSNTTRSDAAALIPEYFSHQIIQNVAAGSSVMKLAKRLANMPRAVLRMPVLDLLPIAYFVSPTDTGMKQTTKVDWANKYVNAEEIAVIVPIPQNVIDDVDYDIWTEVQPRLEEAFGATFDAAVLYGTGAPASWPVALVTAAIAAGKNLSLASTAGDLYDAILSENGLFSYVEAQGFDVNASMTGLSMKSRLRGVRSTTGEPIFMADPTMAASYMLDGRPLEFPKNGSFDSTTSLMVSGDWTQLVYSFRQDITYKLITEGVITDGATPPNIIYNLPQQDMVALRAVMRVGWQVPNPVTKLAPTEATRYPFAVLQP